LTSTVKYFTIISVFFGILAPVTNLADARHDFQVVVAKRSERKRQTEAIIQYKVRQKKFASVTGQD
jgi:hypothetical protein